MKNWLIALLVIYVLIGVINAEVRNCTYEEKQTYAEWCKDKYFIARIVLWPIKMLGWMDSIDSATAPPEQVYPDDIF